MSELTTANRSFSGRMLAMLNKFGPLLALLVVYAYFAIRVPDGKLTTVNAFQTMIIQTVIVGIVAVGMTAIIIAGGIDLSIGSTIALSSVVAAYLLEKSGCGSGLAIGGGILAGAIVGLFNGLIITRLKLVPFIVTLGTMLIIRGIAKRLANSAPINAYDKTILSFMRSLSDEQSWMIFPPGPWLLLGVAVLFALMLRYTRLGRHTFAIGSNEQTARLCGVAVERVKLYIYTLAGACGGLSGVMLLSRQNQGDPTSAQGLELDIIAAVVIGGGSLSGGEGTILGSIIGAMIMTVIRTGCNLLDMQVADTQILTGVIIVVAVALDRLRHRRAA